MEFLGALIVLQQTGPHQSSLKLLLLNFAATLTTTDEPNTAVVCNGVPFLSLLQETKLYGKKSAEHPIQRSTWKEFLHY